MNDVPHDHEIRERLSALTKFVPFDHWDHVIKGLRLGKVYYVVEVGGGNLKCSFMEGPNFGTIEELLK